MPFFAAQQSLFRAYDIRGSRQLFTTNFIQALGKAFARLYVASECDSTATYSKACLPKSNTEKTIIVIGYDVRFGSDIIAQRLAEILTQCGLQVIQLGLVTTPLMVFWAEQNHGHGIVLTASHSAKDILGIKWLVNHQSPSSTEIQALYQQVIYQQFTERALDDGILQKTIVQKNSVKKTIVQKSGLPKANVKKANLPINARHNIILQNDDRTLNTLLKVADSFNNSQQTSLSSKQVATTYIEAIAQVFEQIHPSAPQYLYLHQHPKDNNQPSNKLNVRLVIDCMHGATSHIAQPLFENFCQQVIMLNNSPDGSFPLGNPDPTEPNRLTQLQQAVLIHEADIGIAFDGDGDRLMIVDNNGKVVTPDHLLYLLAQVALTERPDYLKNSALSAQILFDIKCSHHLPKLLSGLGATPVISKTGSSMMRQQMQQSHGQIIFAGELSGHFIFNDSRFIIYDDAMYAALRLLHWLAADDAHGEKSLTDITEQLPAMVSTADHYLPMPKTIQRDCSVVQQLARLCHYLRQLVDSTVANADSQLIATYPPSYLLNSSHSTHSTHCHCSLSNQYTTIEQAKALLPVGTTLSCIDGVRLDFAHGFGVIRQSNTSHHLTARFAGDSIEDLRDIQAKFATLCREFDADLAAQIVAIAPES